MTGSRLANIIFPTCIIIPITINTAIRSQQVQFHSKYKRYAMAVPTNLSFVLSITLLLLLIAFMQLYKINLASTQMMTIIGGFLGSMLFVTLTTAIGNLEKLIFGAGFQMKVIEVAFALIVSMFVSGTIHRVCVTTCFIFSMIALYYVNKISQSLYGLPAATTTTQTKKKK